jgi:hypothetical protein
LYVYIFSLKEIIMFKKGLGNGVFA